MLALKVLLFIRLCATRRFALCPGYCPEIFDGFLCWGDTEPGTIANQSCPNNMKAHFAFKECWPNGSWFTNAANITWTDYQHCTKTSDEVLEFYRCINFLYIIGYSISSIALLASLVIFLSFRTLRCTRIKIHVQLFSSFLTNNVLSIIWYTEIVTKVAVTTENPFWCKLLHVAKEYFMVANYIWMFCEALHLYIALELVFLNEEKTMKWFYVLGWGVPFLIVFVHNMVRVFHSKDTERCLMQEDSFSAWFISVPVVLSLGCSMVFLVDILRVLLTIRNPSSQNPAPDGIRKAVRAAFILTPLFGLQFILIPVKPDSQHPLYATHQYFSMIIIAYQGLCCAALFCFANHEVHQSMKRSFQRKLNFHNTRSTNFPTVDSNGAIGANGHNCTAIPLLAMRKGSAQIEI
ncbi:calcitonin gene-related peptide type 1 receptor-like isoform X1 [Euwallacea fornicatus]|uniref:calcitonin gene-related peptide type 1 receptor-like isoform X1 n=1 Tax=Euwallacea fornicatus TaxID=995702 RepID=UPI00338FCBC7